MGLSFRNNTSPAIAVEFGADSLKAIQLAQGETLSLIAAACDKTPAEHRHNPETRLVHQASILPKLLKQNGFKGNRVVFALPPELTFVQHMQVQQAEGALLQDLAAAQLESSVECAPGSMIIRANAACEINRAGSKRTEIICTAIHRGIVMEYVKALRAMKLETVGVHSQNDALAVAMARFARRTEDEDRTQLCIDMGAKATKVVVLHGAKTVFAKSINIAGSVFDEHIANALECSIEKAHENRLEAILAAEPTSAQADANTTAREDGTGSEQARSIKSFAAVDQSTVQAAEKNSDLATQDDKREPDALPPGSWAMPETNNAASLHACGVDLSRPLELLTDEIATCVRYHRGLFPERRANQIVFVGGESRWLGLCQEVAKALRLPAQIADPMASVDRREKTRDKAGVNFTKPQPGWSVPVGLCLSPTDI